MKKMVIVICCILLAGLLTVYSNSALSAVTPTATAESDLDKIEKIKDMVASRVAQLNLVERRGIVGYVSEVSSAQITLNDLNNNPRGIDIDELTKFEGPTNSFGLSDIKTGDFMSFVGLYNKDTKRLIARFGISEKPFPTQFEGIVSSIDSNNYTVTVVDDKGASKVINIDVATKTFVFSKPDSMVRSGFSKISKGERMLVTGYYDLKNKSMINADRILRFTDISPSLQSKMHATVTASPSATLTPTGKQ